MIGVGDYTIRDIKDLILDSIIPEFTLGLNDRFKFNGTTLQFVGVSDSILLYNPITFEPYHKKGIYYVFKIVDSIIRQSTGLEIKVRHDKINPKEWEKLN